MDNPFSDFVSDGTATPDPFAEFEGYAENVPEMPDVLPINKSKFLAQKKYEMLQDHSSEFGAVPNDRELPQTIGFFDKLGLGKNVKAAYRGYDTQGGDADHLMGQLKDLEDKHPDIMNSTEGEAFRVDIENRIDTALNAPEMDFTEITSQLVNYATEQPGALADLILDETGYNPILTIASVAALAVGGPVGGALGSVTQLKRIVNVMKMGTARQRVAAFTLEKVIAGGAGVAAVEGGVGAADEYLRNKSVGRDRFHNVLTTAEFGAALGFGMNAVGAGFKVARGDLRASKSFEEVVMDYQKRTGATESEVVQAFKENMDRMPSNDDVRAVMETKVDFIADNVPAFDPTKRRQLSDADVTDIATRLDDDFDPNPVTTRPVGTDKNGKSFFNAKNIMDDIRVGFNHLYGKSKDGTLGVSIDAVARQNAFETLNLNAFARYMATGNEGPKRYSQFLMLMEQNRKKLMDEGSNLDAAGVYRKAAEDSITKMGGDYSTLLKRSLKQRTFDNIKAGTTHAGATVAEYLKDPKQMYTPLKDIFDDTKEFVRDIVKGPVEGADNALLYRDKMANLLRDWEGNRMRGELEIDRVQRWIKSEVKDPKKREAISHYLEGNLDEYNQYRRINNLDEITLTPADMKVASVARQFMDDVFDMAQKSEMLMGFKKNKLAYKKLREKLGKSTSIVDTMLIPVKFVDEVATDGRLAQLAKDGTVNVRKGITKAEIIKYLTEGNGPTGKQKQVIQEYMNDSFGLNLLDEIAKLSDDDAVRFLVAHEKGHAMQKKKYGKQFNYTGTSGKRGISQKYGMDDPNNRFLTDRAIKLEADANKYALQHLNDSQKLHDEIWRTVKSSDDPQRMAAENLPSSKLPKRDNYVTHLTSHKRVPTDQDLLDLSLDDAHRASQLQTRSRFTKKRKYDTLMDAIYAGETIYSQDIATLINTYGRSMVRAQLNNRLTSYLANMRTLNGYKMMGSKHEVPDYYVKFTHPNFKGPDGEFLYVNPNLAPDLRMYFETSTPSIANRILQNIIMISKRASLGLSFFHMAALAWSGMATGQNPIQVFKNVMPGFKSKGLHALAGQEGYDELMHGLRNGLGIGVVEELKGDTLINAMRTISNAAEMTINNLTHVKPLGKTVAAPLRILAKSQELIDTHLWDHVNTGLKATTYLAAINRLVLADARRANKTGTPMTDINLLRQRAAQFTNDAYGAQNWNQMAMNVRGHMKHRIAAALNKPTMRGYVRMLIFAPDWTFSNLRVIGKIADHRDKAHSEYLKYSIRSALLFAFVGEVLQQSSGEGSIFDDSLKDALRPDIGGGKQMEVSKQLSEVIRIGIHGPVHSLSHKLGTLPKSMDHTDSISDYLGFWMESTIPIGVKQGIETGNIAGTLGAPIYNK